MLEEGQIIKLSDGKEYAVVRKINAHSFNYVYLATSDDPLNILVGTINDVNGSLEFNEIKDNVELDYALALLD